MSLLLPAVLQSWRVPGSTQRSTRTFPSRCWTGTVVWVQRRSVTTPGASAATNSSSAAWGLNPRTANSSVSFLSQSHPPICLFSFWKKNLNQLNSFLSQLRKLECRCRNYVIVLIEMMFLQYNRVAIANLVMLAKMKWSSSSQRLPTVVITEVV